MESLRTLLLGGPADAARRLVQVLEQGGYAPVLRRVQSAGALQRILRAAQWDVVLLNRPLPSLDLFQTLALAREQERNAPVIIVSETIRPNDAAAAMRAGAADYMTPDDLTRLVPAIERELRAAAERRAREQAEAAWRHSEVRTNTLLEKSFDGVVLVDAEGRAMFTSPAVQRILGFTAGELLGTGPLDVVHPADVPQALAVLEDLRRRPGEEARIVYRLRHRDGDYRWVEVLATNLLDAPAVGALVLNLHDVTERIQAQEARNRLAAIVESTGDAIIGLSEAGLIESWNAGAAALFGYGADEIVGRHIRLLAPPAKQDEQEHMLADARRGQRRIDYETTRLRKDGSPVDVAITISPITDATGAVDGLSVILRDITERRQAFAAMLQARAAMEDLAQRQRDFVATASHELRTPLTAMVGYAELLRDRWSSLDDTQRLRFLGHIIAAAQRQQRLVEDLLLLSRLESATPVIVSAVVSLPEVVRRACDDMAALHDAQAVRLDGPLDFWVRADAERVVQIVANLLDNAAKYSPEGAPIEVWWQEEGDASTLRVRDHGAGVPEQYREQLFRRFGKIPGSPIRAGRVGTGLGLYLSQQLASAMGGDLDLESTGAEGSTFRLRLPLAEPPM